MSHAKGVTMDNRKHPATVMSLPRWGNCGQTKTIPQILRKPAAFLFAVLCIIVCRPFSIFGAVGLFRSDELLIFNMVWPWFLWGHFLSVHSLLSRQRHDIRDFSCCPLPRVLHVALVSLQKLGFEFHLKSSPSACSGHGRSVDQLITSLLATARWRDPTRSK